MTHEEATPRLPELVGLRPAAPGDGELEAHVAECARCQERLARLRRIDAGLRSLDAAPAASAGLERRVLAIPGTGANASAARSSRGRRWAVAAACAAVLVAAVGGLLATRDDDPGAPGFAEQRTVELVAAEAPQVSARIEIGAAEGGRIPMRIVATGLPHGGDRYYGLWLTESGGAISGGSFRPDGEGRCVVLLQVPAGEWTAVDITSGDRPPSGRTTVAGAEL